MRHHAPHPEVVYGPGAEPDLPGHATAIEPHRLTIQGEAEFELGVELTVRIVLPHGRSAFAKGHVVAHAPGHPILSEPAWMRLHLDATDDEYDQLAIVLNAG